MARLVHRLFDEGYVRAMRRERVIRDRRNPLDIYDDVELYDRFRFRRNELLEIMDELAPHVEHTSLKNNALPCELQILIALRFFASGSFQNEVGDMIGVHKSTSCRAIRRVTLALERISPRYVYFPQDPRELVVIKEQFLRIANFPNVVACVDGTHVKILCPPQEEYAYVNRKGYHSINVQLMCDATLRIVNYVVRWPGSTHDARILTESEIYQRLENHHDNMIILGDSGYPSKVWLMVPFLNPRGQNEQRYNQSHMSTRSTIERCNGVLKRRFACLQYLRMTPPRACSVIKATIVLHNKCIRYYGIEPDMPLPENDVPVQPHNVNQDVSGQIARRQLVATYFSVFILLVTIRGYFFV